MQGDIEMQMPARNDKVTRTIVTTVEREEGVLYSPPPIPTDLRDYEMNDRDNKRLTR
jgi:hypothetical protein